MSKVNIPTGVITICGDTFCGCTSLKTITIPSTVENIQERVFMGSGLTSITIPANVLAIDGESFSNCSNLTRIVIENRKLVLGPDMFVGDSKLTIYGYTGSTAEAYAKANNIPFSALEEGSAEPIEKVTLSKLKSMKLKALSAKKLEVKWKKLSKKGQSKIQKIEIQYSTDKTFKTGVKKKWAKKTKNSYTIKGLKKNTKYWVRIRAWKKDGNIIYVSKWVTKNKKTKKK